MGEYAEKPVDSLNSELTVVEDMSVARDIARRFEQLESQWLRFQKSSAKLEGEEPSGIKPGVLLSSRLQGHIVPSTAFSYSNPLFTTHKPLKKKSTTISPRTSLAAARSSLSLLTSLSPDTILSSKPIEPLLSSSEKQWQLKREEISNEVMPDAGHRNSLSSKRPAGLSGKFAGITDISNCCGGYTAITSSSSPEKSTSYSSSVNCDSLSKPTSSSSPGSATNSDRPKHSSTVVPAGRSHLFDSEHTFQPKLPLSECTGEAWSSPARTHGDYTQIGPLDPTSFSLGKGLSGQHTTRMPEDPRTTEAQSSRSPPPVTPSASSARETELQSDNSQMESRGNFRGKQLRRQPWQTPIELSLLHTERAPNVKRLPSQTVLEEKRLISDLNHDSEAANCIPSLIVKASRPEAQIDWQDRTEICALMQKKLDHTVNKVEWELRLSKKESRLRSAEEALLEEQQKLAEQRIALSKFETILSQREESVQHLEQIRDIQNARESVETGSVVVEKLVSALKDVLVQMEQKDKSLREFWSELKETLGTDLEQASHSLGFEPDQFKPPLSPTGFEGLNVLVANGDRKEWCRIVIDVCERLVGYLSKETQLQKWAMVLEKESTRLRTLEEEIQNTKESTAEHFERAAEMMKNAEEQCRVAEEERISLNKERDGLVQWVTHLQERRKAVTECEREAASSLAQVQKKAADLFVHESSIDGKALEITSLQEELWATSQRLHEDQEAVNKERIKVQERLRQVTSRERDVESQLQFVKKLKEELDEHRENFERERLLDDRRRENAYTAQRELEAKLNLREMTLRDVEKELAEKAAAAESFAAQLNDREKLLNSMHDQCEHERSKAKDLIADLEKERKRLKDAEMSIEEAHVSKKNADDAWARVAKERREADDYLKSVEERIKAWEDRLRVKEKELQQQEFSLREIESRMKEEQDQSQAKLTQEKENWTEELKAKQESLAKRAKILVNKEAEIKSDLEKLAEERRLAIDEIKRFAEIEARAWAAERELQTKQDEHLQLVRKHAKEYRAQLEELEVARGEVEKEFEEVHTKRDELQIWQREAEATLQSRINSFVKGKEELQIQIQELKKLQMDIEQAGAQIIDRVAELDQASSKLEMQRSKVEVSKTKLESLAKTLAKEREAVRDRESALSIQARPFSPFRRRWYFKRHAELPLETSFMSFAYLDSPELRTFVLGLFGPFEENVASAVTDIKKMNAEATAKERNLRYREQAVIDSENDLKELEARLANERKDLEKMIAEVEQHAATLKEETAAVEESSRNRSREELLVEEKKEYIFAREKELAAYESELKNKALSLEEHSQAIAKLELQVQERWEKLREEKAAFQAERESLAAQKEGSQNWKAEQDRLAREDVERKAKLREELDRQKAEMLAKLREREASLNVREARVAEREASLQLLERDGKNQVQKDAQELRQQLNGARAELDSQRRYVEDKRRIAEAIAATIEEREAKLKVREREVEKRELSLEEKERKLNLEGRDSSELFPADSQKVMVDFRKMQQEKERLEPRRNGNLEKAIQDDSLYTMDLTDYSHESTSKDLAALDEERRHAHRKQREEMARHRLKEMEDALHKEASKILQERQSLQAQQKELEETRKAVQDVKVTLTAQLKATKQMVADAALTAQNASREREALEEERRRLERAQKEAEMSLAAKEAKLSQETTRLENMRNTLLQEKTQAMDVLQNAVRAAEKERRVDVNFMQCNKNTECGQTQQEREFAKTVEALHREKLSLQEEKARIKMLHDVLEREKREQSQSAFQQATAVDAQKEAEIRRWRGISKWSSREENSYPEPSHDVSRDGRASFSQDFAVPSYREAVERQSLGTNSDMSTRTPFTPSPPERMDQNRTNVTNTSWDGGSILLSSPGSSLGVRVHQTASAKRVENHMDHLQEGNAPSKKRLENVMTSLLNARQASRSRLQRTENALLGFPPSSPFTSQVQQALNALSSRLSLMEQIEDGLASHLRKAHETDYSESEGLIVDKVQLLCRMQEQQSLRAEWEEDMQQQLETISMLQAASRNASTFTTPAKGTSSEMFQCPTPRSDWQGADCQNCNSETPQDGGVSGLSAVNSGSSGPNQQRQFPSPDWKMTFEPLLGVDSKGLSLSPLVDQEYYSNLGQNPHQGHISREYDTQDKFVRRKLYLSPSANSHYAAQ
ncbi:hypothetical protein R1flu_004068 [Riccia fluitans]|uniref:Uncharacterized protein n=1 Tax=Riccia fluitans TaxID=41844 RepID=A0ABD1YS85_9MARC